MTLVLEQEDASADLIRIVLATKRPEVREALEGALHSVLAHADACVADDLSSLLKALSGARAADIVLLDLETPAFGGLAGLLFLRSQHSQVPLVALTASENTLALRRIIEAGAAGCLPAQVDSEMVYDAIHSVLEGEIWTTVELDLAVPSNTAACLRRLASLTPQQMRVLVMLSQNLLNKQIAYELGVSEATVKAHVSAILQKLDVEGRCQAVQAVAKMTHDVDAEAS